MGRDFHRRIFSTVIHNFAQIFWTISIDEESEKDYFARRLNRSFEDFTVRFRVRDYLMVFAIPNGTGKYKDFTIQRGRANV